MNKHTPPALASLSRVFSLIEQARTALNLANELINPTSDSFLPTPPAIPKKPCGHAPAPWLLILRKKYGTSVFTVAQIKKDFPSYAKNQTVANISTITRRRPDLLRQIQRGTYQFLP